jgi:hypothetical protein
MVPRRRQGRDGRRRGRGADRIERVGPEHVLEAARVLRAALAPHLYRDWSVRAGDLTWSCRETLLHAADFWYAAGGPRLPWPAHRRGRVCRDALRRSPGPRLRHRAGAWRRVLAAAGPGAARARPAVSVGPRWRPMDDAAVVQRPRGPACPRAADRLVVAPGTAQRVGRHPPPGTGCSSRSCLSSAITSSMPTGRRIRRVRTRANTSCRAWKTSRKPWPAPDRRRPAQRPRVGSMARSRATVSRTRIRRVSSPSPMRCSSEVRRARVRRCPSATWSVRNRSASTAQLTVGSSSEALWFHDSLRVLTDGSVANFHCSRSGVSRSG